MTWLTVCNFQLSLAWPARAPESGDLAIPITNGTISKDNVYAELHEIVGGKKPGRTSDHEITCWKSVGLTIEDAAVAGLVYAKAKKEGIGTEVEL